jgi:5-methylcytosine-specific restriction endonuclease McrA
MSKKTSQIWKIDHNSLQNILDTSSGIVDVLRKLNLNPHSGNHRTLHRRLKQENFCLDKLEINRREKLRSTKKTKIKLTDIFIENSLFGRSKVRQKAIVNNLLPYECSNCKNKGYWLNKNLSLQLEHINGISNDNRLSNLAFLCPNCHSQTKTFAGRKNKKPKKICPDCNTQTILRSSIRCNKCNSVVKGNKQRKFNISKQELKTLLMTYTINEIGKKYNVSFNTVKKYCVRYNLYQLIK